VIEHLWSALQEFGSYIGSNFDPVRDLPDVLIVTLGIYWLLVLIRGTRAVQILVGLIVLLVASAASNILNLLTLRLILENFLGSAVIIIVILFQHDIRRALARVGRGFFPTVSAQQESQMLEEIVRAAQKLSTRRVGALIVLERDTHLDDQIEAGTSIDADVSKELLISIFLTQSPLHDGAVVIQQGRIAHAGCILPLTLREDLPEGVGTRHRAAVGITEETDAVVVVISEETGGISVVLRGEMAQNLDPPILRVLLRDILGGEREDLRNLSRTVETMTASRESERSAEAGESDSVRSAS
jgi:diadenylate cyclase